MCESVHKKMDAIDAQKIILPSDVNPSSYCYGYAGSGSSLRGRFGAGTNCGGYGWRHSFVWKAYPKHVSGTTAYCVGRVTHPYWRYKLAKGSSCKPGGWTHLFHFYAYESNKPNTQVICFANSNGVHRVMASKRSSCSSIWSGFGHGGRFYA